MVEIPVKHLLAGSVHYFVNKVFGYRTDGIHGDMLDYMLDNKYSLTLISRGHGKSRMMQGYITWLMCNNPEKRIILVSNSDRKAQMFLNTIKHIIEQSPIIKHYYGDLKNPNDWSAHSLVLNTRTGVYTEPNLLALGSMGGSITGMHADAIFIDDLVDFESSRSDVQRNRVKEWYKTSLLPVLLSGGEIHVAGTRYHFMDYYDMLINQLEYPTLVMRAVQDDGSALCEWLVPIDDIKNSNGEVAVRGLNSIKHDLGAAIFDLQYNNSVDMLKEGNIINSAWIQYYSQLPELDSVIIACDPAISKSDTADYTAIIIGGRAKDGNVYIKNYINARMSFNETIQKLTSLISIHNPEQVRIEKVGFSEAFITELKRESPATFINGIAPRGDKESRLREVSPLMENMLVWFGVSHQPVIDQLLLFNDGDHDDLVDAMSLFLSYYKKPAEGCIVF